MELDELKDYVHNIFADCPEVSSITVLMEAMEDTGVNVSYDEMHDACEVLVAEGVIQRAGRQGYEATLEFMEENNHEIPV